MSEENESNAMRFFREHPELRERIRQSKEFENWRTGFRELELDGVRYFVARGTPMVQGGDRLLDEDELMLEWAQQSGLVPPSSSREADGGDHGTS